MPSIYNRLSAFLLPCIVVLIVALVSNELPAQQGTTDLNKLRSEVGGSVVDGAGVICGQAEASNGTNYFPDLSLAEFANKTFWDGTGNNNGSFRNHATNMAKWFYGSTTGFARGVSDITMFDANDWLNNRTGFATGRDPGLMLNTDPSGSNPNPQPIEVINHSWVVEASSGITSSQAQNILQRLDFMINRDNSTVCVGADNGGGATEPLLVPGYNTLSVGQSNGSHAKGPTTFYGSGRNKPEIVVDAGTSSRATAVTSGCAAILRQHARDTNAENNEVIKALLLAGATKEEFADWDRTATRPYDEVYGCGEVNIYNSYFMLLGGEFDGADMAPGVVVDPCGWDYSDSINTEKFYAIDVPEGLTKASVVLTWNMQVNDVNASPNVFNPQTTLANMDLELLDSSGNVVDSSVSTNNNIEHIYVENLAADVYTLRVSSNINTDFALAWRISAATVLPTEQFVTNGVVLNGDISDLEQSDNQKLVPATGADSLVLDFKSFVPQESLVSLKFTLESSVRAATPVTQQIYLYDYVAGAFELFDTRDARVLGDAVVEVQPTGDVSRFIQPGTRCVEAQVVFSKQGLARGVQAFIDQAVWTYTK